MLAIFSFFSSPFALSLSKRSDLHLDETSTKRVSTSSTRTDRTNKKRRRERAEIGSHA
jgi:hypothetical protein